MLLLLMVVLFGLFGEAEVPAGVPLADAEPPAEVRIMPLGDSITYENHRGDTRLAGERIAYRYRLWELLSQAGYAFDFVGNRNAGLNYFTDPDDADNAGFPGIKTDELGRLLITGGGGENWKDQAPGPYLDHYPADLILLHIGTNGMHPENWTQVRDILDTIDQWEKSPGHNPITTIVARIIDCWPLSEETQQFNDNVEAMIESRYASGDDVLLVDIEKGAGIDYRLEMDDKLHPRRSGYSKMAEQWFPAVTAALGGRPYVAIRSPLPGASYDVSTPVLIEADVYFHGGTVKRVDFYIDGAKIGSDATAPYSINWTAEPGPYHELKAVAVYGGSSESESRPVVVNPWRILALGDSITQGEYGHNSYRYELWKKLDEAGVPFRFVGSMHLLKGEVLGYWRGDRENQVRHEYPPYRNRWFDQDRYHDGHWGWRADEILNGRSSAEGSGRLADWLGQYTPDVALVHLGTNDALQGQSASSTAAEIESVVATLRADNASVVVLLGKLIPTAGAAHNRIIDAINAEIDKIAASLSTASSPVVVVDHNQGFEAGLDTYDGIHPDASGEAKMAQAWFASLAALLNGRQVPTASVGRDRRSGNERGPVTPER